ncbi:ROK family protein [Amnibacterium sp. CER49]|uniref:ROK family protein n=1 Tax=Amnibacterium sp. CER49 TaxID=3039161 RepID=UPI00244CCE6D|nr:ROK family protein [Amnibacterium sp. CER49]MDH2443310.1 ROK family protein [Amnibacterium sp. CER49]
MSDSVGRVRIGIDIGGTGTRVVSISGDDRVQDSANFPTPPAGGADPLQFLSNAIRSVAGGATIAALGIGASGPIDARGVIRNPDTLEAFTGVDLLEPLSLEFGIGARIDNDAVTAALYEAHLGVAAGAPSVLVITLGTGVGVALILDGTPVRGADGVHPEAGHLNVNVANCQCYCGRDSCWEQAASRAGLERLAIRSGRAELTALADTARTGDAAARGLFEMYGLRVAMGLSDLVGIYRPTTVVFAGGSTRYWDLIEHGVREGLAATHSAPEPQILLSSAGPYGGAIGATLFDREPGASKK